MKQTVLQKIPHTYQRNGIYYLCVRVPKVIREFTNLPPIIRQSLQTKSSKDAKRLISKVIAQLSDLKVHCVSNKLDKGFRIELSEGLTTLFQRPYKYDFDGDKGKEMDAVAALNAAEVVTYKTIGLEAALEFSKHSSSPRVNQPDSCLPLFSEAIDEFIASKIKNGTKEKDRDAYERELNYWKAALGDKAIDSYTRSEFYDAFEIMKVWPLMHKTPFNHVTAEEVVERFNKDDLILEECESRAHSSVKASLKALRAMFDYYFHDKMVLENNIPKLMKYKIPKGEVFKTPYASLDCDKGLIYKVVDHWLAQSDSDTKWVILLGAYTGARRGDILGLRRRNIMFDKVSARYYFDIEKGKTDAAERKIPMHIKLIEAGFLHFINSKKIDGNDFIFECADNSNFNNSTYTERLKSSFEILGIPKANKDNKRYVFHSLRHTVFTHVARKAGEITKTEATTLASLQVTLGHKIKGIGVTKVYIDASQYKVKDLAPIIDAISW